MAVLTLAQLKTKFSSTSRPTQQDYTDLIDTLAEYPTLAGVPSTAFPIGPAGGGLSGNYPDPAVRAKSIILDHFSPLEAQIVAPGGTVQDLAIPVFQGSTKSFVYRNWYSLPGLVAGGPSTPTTPTDPTAPPDTSTSGSARLYNSGWYPFPGNFGGTAPVVPQSYLFNLPDSLFKAALVWGETMCSPADTAPDVSYTPYPDTSIVPMSQHFSQSIGAAEGADILSPLFVLFLQGTQIMLQARVPLSTSVMVVQTSQMTVDTEPATLPANRLTVIPINPANWQFRVKALHITV